MNRQFVEDRLQHMTADDKVSLVEYVAGPHVNWSVSNEVRKVLPDADKLLITEFCRSWDKRIGTTGLNQPFAATGMYVVRPLPALFKKMESR